MSLYNCTQGAKEMLTDERIFPQESVVQYTVNSGVRKD